MSFKRVIFGRRLANNEQAEQKIGVVAGVPALGLDGLASSSYGPEAALTILVPAGAAGLVYIGPIVLVILALLLILYLSYRQTIGAYPNGGGSYTVAKENLGTFSGLLAAAALLLDYVLNVAVAISAGVAALTSAFPTLHPYTVPLCLAVLGLIAVANLRGTREAGVIFSAPTYVFIASFALVIGMGVYKSMTGGGHPQPVAAPPPLPPAVEGVGVWLLMRAFASGCTAMTGVEAVSNGVSAFRDPAVVHARRTLTAICVILGSLLAGVAYLAHAYGIGAMDQTKPDYQSVMSQLVAAVAGRGATYYVAVGSMLIVLALSANTSFAGFPRLCGLIAEDQFLPRFFENIGRRLVYSSGIFFLTISAGVLLVAFGGITDRLIPLFAIGAFGAFTLSQAGMVVHWRRAMRQGEGNANVNRLRLGINLTGAMTTGVALLVILAAKFVEGAWITLLVIPPLILLFRQVKGHYLRAERLIRPHTPLSFDGCRAPVIIIPTVKWNQIANKAVQLAVRISPDVRVVHLADLDGRRAMQPDDSPEETNEARLRRCWSDEVVTPARQAGYAPPVLEIIQTPYRKLIEPLFDYLDRTKAEFPDRQIAVVIPEIVKQRWWHFLLHNYRAQRLRSALLRRGDRRLVLINVPWYLET